jgi:hypothetical protein
MEIECVPIAGINNLSNDISHGRLLTVKILMQMLRLQKSGIKM